MQEEENICICCKDIFELPEDIYKLTCGHIGHYECFYMSFKFNIKRGSCVLECPYCRKNVKPLPDKTGFNHCQFIHDGLSITNVNSTKLFQWTANHEGTGYCKYSKNGSYCNVKFGDWGNGPNKDMCYTHKNYTHYGNNYCKACKSGKYCNNLLTLNINSKHYCWKHKDLENKVECSHVKLNGVKCLTLTSDKTGMCDKHNTVCQNTTKKENVFKCKEVFKSGKRKGTVCNVINCKRHSKTPIESDVLEKTIIKSSSNAFVPVNVNSPNNSKETLDLTETDGSLYNSKETLDLKETIIHYTEEIINNTEEIVNNTQLNYDINSFDASSHNISYLCADIGSLLDELSDSTDIVVENSLQVIKSLLISLKKNNIKLNK